MDNRYIEEIIELLRNGTTDEIRRGIMDYHPYEVSEALVEMSEAERAKFYSVFQGKDISAIMGYLDIEDLVLFFEEMKPRYIVNIIQDLDIDDAVDVMQALPEEDRAAYLKLMTQDNQSKIRSLLKYQEDTAGSIMTTEYIEIDMEDSVEQAMKKLIAQAVDAETISTLYVTDSKNVLVGTLSLREIILARKGQVIKDIMNARIISVPSTMDQEEVAAIFKDYDFTSLPVVDKLSRMLGIITIDDIVDVIDEEAVEDYSRLAAVSDVDIDSENETIWMSAKKRLPWLLVLSILGFATSTIIAQFETTLAAVPTIALFMPMILGMAGNTGTQALAVTVRGLNNNEFDSKNEIGRHLLRELGTGLLNGVIIGVILFAVTYGFLAISQNANAFSITQAVSLAIMVSLTVSTFAGALIPIVINSFKVDPAVASGPFVTMVVDILAISVYFTLATVLIINTL
ncbi:magnesium transporter [Candidatus Xianfuyuplasma coldseepsis]|uniref:Magnesium transporter MgtE n=1 Tax=Candidatus Xianfuyuplasma coldseepsis TaxID=2782163 RepID=A0A7L7KRZ6_9MOLU|nr:magnesium transporter [Xianfuyuplasma coldseepsis]QMS85600.1 magnesium transporter [Xianfuyuplasma coldseepsis]